MHAGPSDGPSAVLKLLLIQFSCCDLCWWNTFPRLYAELRGVRECVVGSGAEGLGVSLVQRFLFYPDGRVHGLTPPVLATQHVFAELRGVHAAAAGRGHAEALLKETLQHLPGRETQRVKTHNHTRTRPRAPGTWRGPFIYLVSCCLFTFSSEIPDINKRLRNVSQERLARVTSGKDDQRTNVCGSDTNLRSASNTWLYTLQLTHTLV